MRITRPHTDPQGFVTWHLRSQQKSSNSVVSSVLAEMNWESKCWVTGHAVGKRGWFWRSPTVGCQRMWHMKTFTTLFDVPHQPKKKTLFSERLTMYSRHRNLHQVATLTSLLKRIVHPKMKLCHNSPFHNCRMYFLLWNTKNDFEECTSELFCPCYDTGSQWRSLYIYIYIKQFITVPWRTACMLQTIDSFLISMCIHIFILCCNNLPWWPQT